MSHNRDMSEDEKPVSDQLKQAIDEMDLEGKVKAAAAAAEDAVFRGLGVAGQYVHEANVPAVTLVESIGARAASSNLELVLR